MKKRFITAVLMTCMGYGMMAQQLPLFSELYFMRMMYNPALTGYNGSTNLYAFDREQWVAMPGHPETRGLMGEISLWKDQSGVGFHVYNDITDIINRVNAQLYYAQKVHLGKDHTLSLGVSVGIMQTRIDYNNIVATDLSDPNLLSSAKGGVAFDMSVGLAYQWKKLTISFAIPHTANSDVLIAEQLKNTTYNTQRQYLGGASYEFSFKQEKWNLEPSVLVKTGSSGPVQVDIDAVANYKRIVFLGVGYRLDYGMTGMAAVRISKAVTLGYAYEYSMVKHVTYSSLGGTHEVVVGIDFDRWIKNPELKRQKKRMDSIEQEMQAMRQYDSTLSSRVDNLQDKNKQIAQDLDESRQNTSELKKTTDTKIDVIQERMDTFEKQLSEYKTLVAKKPVTKFSEKVEKIKTKNAGGKAGQPVNSKDYAINQGDVFKMDQVTFERNSSYLKTESFAQLDKLAEIMKSSPDMKVKVMGHTDYVASDQYNLWLSEKRAKRVADYLISKGVPAANITSVGFGKRSPIGDNSTEEGRALNRRVEIAIMKN